VIRDLTCREFVEFLDDYIAGALPVESRAEFDKHLSDCPSCVAYMATYQQAIVLGRQALLRSDDPVPDTVPEKLVQAILAARTRR